jgi:hypothetical protein
MPSFTAPLGVDSQRQTGRIDLLERFQGQRSATAESERDFERSQQQAFDALRSRQAWHAFSLQDEPLALTERHGDNRSGMRKEPCRPKTRSTSLTLSPPSTIRSDMAPRLASPTRSADTLHCARQTGPRVVLIGIRNEAILLTFR